MSSGTEVSDEEPQSTFDADDFWLDANVALASDEPSLWLDEDTLSGTTLEPPLWHAEPQTSAYEPEDLADAGDYDTFGVRLGFWDERVDDDEVWASIAKQEADLQAEAEAYLDTRENWREHEEEDWDDPAEVEDYVEDWDDVDEVDWDDQEDVDLDDQEHEDWEAEYELEDEDGDSDDDEPF